jgi:hypothetical protein
VIAEINRTERPLALTELAPTLHDNPLLADAE